jgi:2-C-methyl-D-erythritol 2,4-cyclodiphosphate synthase
MTRTGVGFDAHDFSDSGTLRLGGVEFSGVPALKGHSDGDALLHAVTDALLGAGALGDIGELFPDTDPKIKGISSVVMLQKALEKLTTAGWRPVFVDTIVVADRPKITPVKANLKKSVAAALGLKPEQVNVKAKTSEGTRLLSEKGGIAAWAAVTVEPRG